MPESVYAQGSVPYLPIAPGTEALGRGGAFAAKADSPLALEYNVAGLAQLGGTQVLLDGQLWFPVEGGPCIDFNRHRQRPCYGGLAAVSTDFGVLRRWTFALGFRLPEPVTAYSVQVASSADPLGYILPPWPPALILAPSLAVGVQAHRRLALGLLVEDAMALHLAPCPSSLDPSVAAGCSSPQVGDRSLMNPIVQLGVLGNLGTLRSTVMLAASVRSAPNLGLLPLFTGPERVNLPWTVRAGARYLHRDRATGRPIGDVELDAVAQLWTPTDLQTAQSLSPLLHNSVGLRLGGSYYVALPHAMLIGRLGLVFDGSLRRPPQPLFGSFPEPVADMQQSYVLSGTFGVGVQTQHLEVNIGYGYANQLTRNSSPGLLGGDTYAGSHLMSLSLLVRLESAPRARRPLQSP